MLQACAQAVDFKVGHHFGEGQLSSAAVNACIWVISRVIRNCRVQIVPASSVKRMRRS
jgi:hypothetical protein